MTNEIRNDEALGRLLWLSDGKTELAAALDVGIRILHLSCVGMENLLYRQPADGSDGLTTPEGWRIFGGHRFWTAPESEKSYYPDRDPVTYTLLEDGVTLRQKVDPWTGFEKTLTVQFREDGAIRAKHTLRNCSEQEARAAAWGVTTLAGGGRAVVPFPRWEENGYNPDRVIALWGGTGMDDPRISFDQVGMTAQHRPLEDYFKLGLYSHSGKLHFTNLGQKLEISFAPQPIEACADLGCNVEVFMDPHVMELETLGAFTTMQPGEIVSHTEFWRVEKAL